MFNRRKQMRMPEGESVGQQFAGHDPAALDEQFGFGAQEKRSDLQQPARCRQAEWSVTSLPDGGHEFRIRHRVRRGEVRWSAKVVVFDDPLHRAAK